MDAQNILDSCSREELVELIGLYSRNLLALDGVWFQSVEEKLGMEEAMHHDREAWHRFADIEGRRIKGFLKLEEHPGLDGLDRALRLRFSSTIHPYRIERGENSLVYALEDCRVQRARSRKGMPYHPCKSVGIIEYSRFAHAIDERILCSCESCYPDITDESCSCKWRFTIEE